MTAEENGAGEGSRPGSAPHVIGGYEIVAKIGEGGMGAVYEARDSVTGRPAALKVLPARFATKRHVERFRREAEVARRLDHRNIVKYLEFGRDEEEGSWYCALELVSGETLSRMVRRRGALPEREAVEVTRQLARALEHAHSHGLVHGDVKPDNVMVTPDGTAKLLDLGIARPACPVDPPKGKREAGGAGVFVGTARYASPEQVRAGPELDARSDIYSLGATLYFMLTARAPFAGETSLAILRKHLAARARPPAEINPGVSDDVCQVVHVMMAKNPRDRYGSASELLRDLEVTWPSSP